ncbi:unnamed protein product [Dovyalis caffra]|uniref:Uncharacterized protein n=1 Tax=Dovyalis caffra TaxID=77055 RepID=A0AAV1QY10_9ROSI|nr:unnamed protein product [Dovyalis caffra]
MPIVRVDPNPRLFPDGTANKQAGGLVSLKNFLLRTNGIGGQIPQEIGNCKHLSLVDLDENRFYGPIPSSLVLRIAGNLLGGKIPDEIVQLNKLAVLDISSNRISGEIPAQIGNLSNLYVLNLKDNMLSGGVPVEIRELSKLGYLDLSMNMLSGPIPYQIGGCSRLQLLRLGKNNLSGTIPRQIGNLSCTATNGKGWGNKKNKLVIFVALISSALFVSLGFVGFTAICCHRRKSRNMSTHENRSRRENPFLIWCFDGRIVYKVEWEELERFIKWKSQVVKCSLQKSLMVLWFKTERLRQ